MHSTDMTVLKHLSQWLAEGETVWLATVLTTYGSSPRQPGAMCAIRADGAVVGSVSGGCIEEDLRDKLPIELADKPLAFLTYGESIEDRDRFRLPCGGTLRLLVEKLDSADWVANVLSALEQRQPVKRLLQLNSGVSLTEQIADSHGQIIDEMSDAISIVYGPDARMLLIGAGEISHYLATMAPALGYKVYVVDPREEMQQTWTVTDAELWPMMPDDAVLKIQADANTSIITLTHDPKLDDMALLEALQSDAFFIGALGSLRSNAKRRERLAMFDLTPEQINRLHGPVGLDIGSKTPAEIAISILSQLTQLKQQRQSQKHTPTQIKVASNSSR